MSEDQPPLDVHALRIMDPFRRGSTSGDSSDSESSLEDVTRVQDENEYSLHDSDDVNDEKAVFLGNDEESLSLSAPAPKHSRVSEHLDVRARSCFG